MSRLKKDPKTDLIRKGKALQSDVSRKLVTAERLLQSIPWGDEVKAAKHLSECAAMLSELGLSIKGLSDEVAASISTPPAKAGK